MAGRVAKGRGAENVYAEPVIDYEQYRDIQKCRKSRDRKDTPEAVFYNGQGKCYYTVGADEKKSFTKTMESQ